MNFDENLFQRVAVPRIKKYYDYNKDTFLARAMDYKDLLQEIRIKLWETLKELKNINEEEVIKMVNKTLTNQLIDEKRASYKHMKKEAIVIESEDKTVIGHYPQFVDIESVNELSLASNEHEKIKKKVLLSIIKDFLSKAERILVEEIFYNGLTEKELACKQINKDCKAKCKILTNLSIYGNVLTPNYQKSCSKYAQLNSLSVEINRFKKKILKKMKNSVAAAQKNR